jgi:hypothetical protein
MCQSGSLAKYGRFARRKNEPSLRAYSDHSINKPARLREQWIARTRSLSALGPAVPARLPRMRGRKQGAPQEERQRSRESEAAHDLGRWVRERIKLSFVSQAILANPYRMQVPPARYCP